MAETATQGEPGTENDEQSPNPSQTALTEEAFKGLQRRVSAKDREIERLTSELDEAKNAARTAPLNDAAAQAAARALQELNAVDPDKARALALELRETMLNQQQRQMSDTANAEAERRNAETREQAVVNELRRLAADLGADPDSSLIDYGNPSLPIAERIALVRETAKATAKPATPPAPKPSVSDGTAHNGDLGVPPTPRKDNGAVVTDAMYQKALAAYREHPCSTHMAEVDRCRVALLTGLGAAV